MFIILRLIMIGKIDVLIIVTISVKLFLLDLIQALGFTDVQRTLN